MHKWFAIVIATMLLCGCEQEMTSKQALKKACLNGLSEALDISATYAGWDLSHAKAELFKIEKIPGDKLMTSQYAYFEVLISGFTLKNGFNADVRSVSTCTGKILIAPNGEYDPPAEGLMDFTLNGQKIGIYGLLNH